MENTSKQKLNYNFSKLKTIIFFAGPAVILSIATFILFSGFNSEGSQNLTLFISYVVISTITSFGSGEAYLSVADGLFVQNGFVPANMFYGTLVAIANALPGSIFVKLASAIAFYFEYTSTGNVVAGYDALKESILLKNLKLYILPVVCDMLMTTSLSMVYEVIKISKGAVVSSISSIGLISVMYSDFIFYIRNIMFMM